MLIWFHSFTLQVRHDPQAPTCLIRYHQRVGIGDRMLKKKCRLMFHGILTVLQKRPTHEPMAAKPNPTRDSDRDMNVLF
jgi:hypothetical protein